VFRDDRFYEQSTVTSAGRFRVREQATNADRLYVVCSDWASAGLHGNQPATQIMLLRRLRHPNILEFSGVFVTKKLGLYLVTEYVEGGTLRQFIKDKSRYAAAWVQTL
jgi:serine/threonine protein kinase